MRQTVFSFMKNSNQIFGGENLKGHRKAARPISLNCPLHLILKSESQRIFDPQSTRLRRLILETAWKFHVELHELAINWTHIHLIVQVKDRQDYVRFIRVLTSKMAQALLKVRPESERLFTFRPFTRIVNPGRDYENAIEYLHKNILQAYGLRKSDQEKKC